MKTGCGVLVLVWIATASYYFTVLRDTEFGWWVPVLLGLSIAVVVANIWGLWVAFLKFKAARKSPTEWRDGEFVAVSGRLTALTKPVVAPASGRSAGIVEFEVNRVRRTTDSDGDTHTSRVADISGFLMAPCGVQGPRGAVRLHGFPLMQRFGQEVYTGPENYESMAAHLMEAEIKPMAGSVFGSLKELAALLSDDDGELQAHFVTPHSDLKPEEFRGPVEVDDLDESRENVSDPPSLVLARRLEDEGYELLERVVPVGMEVAAFGTYRAAQRAMDIGSGLTNVRHSLEPGSLSSAVRKTVIGTLVSLFLVGAVSVAGHYFVFESVRVRVDEVLTQLARLFHKPSVAKREEMPVFRARRVKFNFVFQGHTVLKYVWV